VGLYHLGLMLVVLRDRARLPRAAGFSAGRLLPGPFSLGALETVEVTIRHPGATDLHAEVADHAPAELSPAPTIVSARFGAAGTLTVSYRTRAKRRGAYLFPSVDVRCWRHPGVLDGWLVRQVRIPCPQQATVYPDVIAVKQREMYMRKGVTPIAGIRRERPPGASTSMSSLRDYLPGDDIRRIHWKASARRDRPVTIDVEAERGQTLVIALDCGRLMTATAGDLTKLDHAINAALLLAWVSISQGDRVGLMAFSDSVRDYRSPNPGRSQIAALNDALYRVRAEYTEPDFGEAFTELSVRLGRRSLVVVLTDVLDPEASHELVAHALRLARKHLVLVVAMNDPAILVARDAPIAASAGAYDWAAAEELLQSRRESFEVLHRGGVMGLDVPAGRLSPGLVERYLDLKQRALL
jgi:uncharacterized protein (DUF58 family)